MVGLDNDVILEYCYLYQELKKLGEPFNDADLIIAATAKAKGLRLLTKDRDFLKLKGLGLLEDIRLA